MSVNVRFQFRRDTTANLAATVLAAGEPVYDITTGGLYVGDGTNAVGSLPTLGGGGGATGATGATGINEVYGIWVGGTPYLARDVVVSAEAPYYTYIAKNDVTGTDDPSVDTTNWALFIQASPYTGATGATGINEVYGTWDVATPYLARDVVVSAEAPYDTYIAKNDVTGGGDPSVSAVAWTLLVRSGVGVTGATGATGIHAVRGTFDVSGASNYEGGDVAISTVSPYDTYIALNYVGGPTTDPSADATNWALLVQAGQPGTNGTNGDPGAPGAQGDPGPPGADGNGITTVLVDGDGFLQVTTTQGGQVSAGYVLGATGATGGFTFSGPQYAVLWSPDGTSVTGTTGFEYNTGEGVTLDVLNIQTTDTGRRVTIGYGATTTGTNSVAIGNTTSAGSYAVSIGDCAGQTTQGASAVAIGQETGETNQGDSAVAVGQQAGQIDQGINSVALGYYSGNSNQGEQSVAIGPSAGSTNQGGLVGCAVAIGALAGNYGQGAYSIAIGAHAGEGDTHEQPDNTIILNASGTEQNGVAGQTGSFYVTPVRTVQVDATSEIATLLTGGETYYQVFYSPATYEFIYVTQAAAI
jgi:hypothetical protein